MNIIFNWLPFNQCYPSLAPLLHHNTQIERAILGHCLLNGACFATVAASLGVDAFYDPSLQAVYQAMQQVWAEGHIPDVLLTTHRLRTTRPTMPCGAAPAYFTATLLANAQHGNTPQLPAWCAILQQLAAKRTLIAITSSGYSGDDVLADAAALQARLTTLATGMGAGAWTDVRTATRQLTALLDAPPSTLPTISTTLPLADDANGGLQPGQLVVLGARPGVGKSALMGAIALKAAMSGHPTAIMSLEMPVTDVLARMYSAHSRIPLRAIMQRDGCATTLTKSIEAVTNAPLWIQAPPAITTHQLRATAHQLHRTGGLRLLIVDYMQLITEPRATAQRSREQGVSAISRALKALAMELEIPVIALSQLNRASEHRADKRPQLSDLRESGAIEQDADIVLLLHRDWNSGIHTNTQGNSTEHHAHLQIAKWRNGRTLNIPLGWDGETLRFWQA